MLLQQCAIILAKREEMREHCGHPYAMVFGVLVLVGLAIIIGLLWKMRK